MEQHILDVGIIHKIEGIANYFYFTDNDIKNQLFTFLRSFKSGLTYYFLELKNKRHEQKPITNITDHKLIGNLTPTVYNDTKLNRNFFPYVLIVPNDESNIFIIDFMMRMKQEYEDKKIQKQREFELLAEIDLELNKPKKPSRKSVKKAKTAIEVNLNQMIVALKEQVDNLDSKVTKGISEEIINNVFKKSIKKDLDSVKISYEKISDFAMSNSVPLPEIVNDLFEKAKLSNEKAEKFKKVRNQKIVNEAPKVESKVVSKVVSKVESKVENENAKSPETNIVNDTPPRAVSLERGESSGWEAVRRVNLFEFKNKQYDLSELLFNTDPPIQRKSIRYHRRENDACPEDGSDYGFNHIETLLIFVLANKNLSDSKKFKMLLNCIYLRYEDLKLLNEYVIPPVYSDEYKVEIERKLEDLKTSHKVSLLQVVSVFFFFCNELKIVSTQRELKQKLKEIEIDIDNYNFNNEYTRMLMIENRLRTINLSWRVFDNPNFEVAYRNINIVGSGNTSRSERINELMIIVNRVFKLAFEDPEKIRIRQEIRERIERERQEIRERNDADSPKRCNCKNILSNLSVVKLRSMLKKLGCKLPSQITKAKMINKILSYHD